MIFKRIRIGKKYVSAVLLPLQGKNLIVLVGTKGYVMCGYLNMKAADAFGDVAVTVSGVATIGDALKTKASAVSVAARELGIRKNQAIKDVLKIIA